MFVAGIVVVSCPGSLNVMFTSTGLSLLSVYVTVSGTVSPMCMFSFVCSVSCPVTGVSIVISFVALLPYPG